MFKKAIVVFHTLLAFILTTNIDAADNKRQSNKIIVNTIGMKFVYIPPGTFMMGSPLNESRRRESEILHSVTLTKGFYMQTTEVTTRQWKAVMGSLPLFTDSCDNCPIDKVSWNDVQFFIQGLNQLEGANRYRLPTEAEWEYTARAGSTSRFCFGDDDGRLVEYAWYRRNSKNRDHPVGQKKPNAWGLYDMHGSRLEYCQDWYGKYPSGSVTNPTGPSSGSYRVIRGGSYLGSSRNLRSAARGRSSPNHGRFSFRLVRTD